MKTATKDSCSYNGYIYHHDAEVCGEGVCMICKDGKLEETTDLFPPKASGILSP
jgi:hypothetical protein